MKQGPVFLFKLNRSGQAAIEYVLLVIVMVTMLFLFKGVFKGLNVFMSDFMGKYIVCLMEHGELPALGVQAADLKTHQTSSTRKCDYTKFAAAAGIGSNGSTSNRNSNQFNDGQNSQGRSNRNSQDSLGENNSANSSGSSSAKNGGSRGGSGSNNKNNSNQTKNSSPYTQGSIARSNGFRAADSAVENPEAARVKIIESAGGEDNADSGKHNNKKINRNGKYIAITGDMKIKELDKKQRAPSSKLISSEENYRAQNKKRTFNPPEPKPNYINEDPTEGFSIGNFFKWLVIAGIIIAAFILFGGQILNYSNSQE